MEAGTTEQCFNAQEGATEEGNEKREKGKPAAHSPKDTHFLSESLTQHPVGRGGESPHTYFAHFKGCRRQKLFPEV